MQEVLPEKLMENLPARGIVPHPLSRSDSEKVEMVFIFLQNKKSLIHHKYVTRCFCLRPCLRTEEKRRPRHFRPSVITIDPDCLFERLSNVVLRRGPDAKKYLKLTGRG